MPDFYYGPPSARGDSGHIVVEDDMSAAKDERHIAGRTADPSHPVQVIFVRMPEKNARTPAPPKRGRRRSPLFKNTRRNKKMIKQTLTFLVVLVISVVAYRACVAYVPSTRSVAIAFPVVAALPLVGAWLAQWSFASVGAIALFGWLSKKAA